jgi:hypothetical protein
MSKVNEESASRRYAEKWQETLDRDESYYTPEKYQLGIVTEYLSKHDITYTTEGEVFCYPIDILAVKRGSTIAIELKSRNVGSGIEQAQRNTDYVDYSFLSLWDDDITESVLKRVCDLDIGLLGVGETVTVYSGPSQTGQELCKRSSVIETILDDVRGDPPIQQQ